MLYFEFFYLEYNSYCYNYHDYVQINDDYAENSTSEVGRYFFLFFNCLEVFCLLFPIYKYLKSIRNFYIF